MINAQSMLFIGRKKYLSLLEAIFNEQKKLSPQLILIGGVSGVGKTSLVEHFFECHLKKADLLLRGKYDEYKSAIPYYGVVQLFREFAIRMQAATEDERNCCGREIADLLNPNLNILHTLVPEFELITGEAESPQELPPMESRNRFLLVINKVIQFILSRNERLILYLDDVHWADKDSIKLIESIIQNDKLKSLYIVCTYRVEEVGLTHALSSAVRNIAKSSNAIHRLDLPELEMTEVSDIVSSKIQLSDKQAEELAVYITEKSRGNPLYVKELMTSLIASNVLDNSGIGDFNVDIAEFKKIKVSDNIVDLLIIKFKKMSDEAQELLKIASCIGTHFSISILSEITGQTVGSVVRAMQEGVANSVVSVDEDGGGKQYIFVHDRIKESAYNLIENKPALHLKIGRVLDGLYKKYNVEKIDLDDIVYHLNAGYKLITDTDEKLSLCRYDLTASLKAKNAGAYSSAISNLTVARALLPVEAWTSQHESTFNIYRNLTECYYLAGNFAKAEELSHLTLTQIEDRCENAEMYCLKVIQLTNLGKWSEALSEGFKGLALFDIDLCTEIDTADVERKMERLGTDGLLNLPFNNDRNVKSVFALMNALVSPIYILKPELIGNLVMIMLKTSLESGNSIVSAYAYDMYGLLIGPIKGDYVKGCEYARLAVKLNEKFDDISIRSRIKLTFATNIKSWVEHIRSGIYLLDEGAIDGLNTGDIVSAGYCQVSKSIQVFSAGLHLEEVNEYIEACLPFLDTSKNPAISLTYLTRQMVLNLQGKTDNVSSLSDSSYDECKQLDGLVENSFLHGVHVYYLYKMMLAIIDDDYRDALKYVVESQNAISSAVGQFSVAEHNFYHSLILSGLMREASNDERRVHTKQLQENLAQLGIWADVCPDNFLHKYRLIMAEKAFLEKDMTLAHQLYKESRELALKNSFIQDAAICCARFAYACEQDDKARAKELRQESCECYGQWGASRKSVVPASQLGGAV